MKGLAVAIFLALVFFLQGYIGRDFGTHWDEPQHVASVVNSVQTGTFLPLMYNYPSFCYWLTALQVVPDVVSTVSTVAAMRITEETPAVRAPAMSHALALTEEQLLIRTRVLCLFLVSLSILWLYLLVVVWRGSQGEALLSAAFLGGSFELAYHARWVAPDALLMQFVLLQMLLLACALRSEKRAPGWLVAAAVVFGMACSVKYTAGIFLLPLLLVAWRLAAGEKFTALRNVAAVALLSLVVFLLITPGAYLQPVYFFFELMKQKAIYGEGWYGATVSGLEHPARVLEYFALAVFSPYPPVSALIVLLALFGCHHALKRDRKAVLLFAVAPLLYGVYFTTQQVMAVRNFLVLLPYLCVFAALGASCLGEKVMPRLRRPLAAVAVLLILANGWWLFSAAFEIAARRNLDFPGELVRYLEAHPQEQFTLSRGSRALLAGPPPQNVVAGTGEASAFIFVTTEYDALTRMNLPANVSGRYEKVAGTDDVNVDYYPSWPERKILRVSLAEARAMKLL